jgi:hypothetical protein
MSLSGLLFEILICHHFCQLFPMASPFRYVFDDNLYLGFSEPMPLENGKKVFGIICPDFIDNYFEVIETGNPKSRYLPRATNCFDPFTQKVIEWFSDNKLLFD